MDTPAGGGVPPPGDSHRIPEEGWVIDGNYSAVQPLVWERADTVIWLDPPRRTVMRRIIWRTIRRASWPH